MKRPFGKPRAAREQLVPAANEGTKVPQVEVRSQARVLAMGGRWWDGEHYVPHNGGVKRRRVY